MAEHTKLPLRTHPVDIAIILDARGAEYAQTFGDNEAEADASAALIVAAVNEREALREALRKAEQKISSMSGGGETEFRAELRALISPKPEGR